MAPFCYATADQLAELMRQSGLSDKTRPTNTFRILARSPTVGAAALRPIFAPLTETDLDQKLRELVISAHRRAVRLQICVGAARCDARVRRVRSCRRGFGHLQRDGRYPPILKRPQSLM
jgi:hypothetical protein